MIFVSFADVKGTTYQGLRDGIICALQDVYRRHAYLLETDTMSEAEKEAFGVFDWYLRGPETGQGLSDTFVAKALKNLSFYLNRYYGKKVLIFLDEYDTPLQEAYVRGCWDQMTSFIQEMFNSTFKTNPYLERSALTGITRVSKESIFSDLNNLKVVDRFFSEETSRFVYRLELTNLEVRLMFEDMIRDWFGADAVPYNQFLKALLLNDVDYMNEYMNEVSQQVFSFCDTGKNPSQKAEPERFHSVKAITKGLTEPNPSACFYHGFVLGLMVELAGTYRVTSNRESGLGRYDVMLEPKDRTKPAYILEFKVRNPRREKTLEDTLQAALTQIEEKGYHRQLTAGGIPSENIHRYGFAFEGKEVLIGGA